MKVIKKLLSVANSALDSSFKTFVSDRIADTSACTALADAITSQILIDVAWVKEAIVEKGLESVRSQVEGSLDVHFDTSGVNQDLYRLFSTTDKTMTKENFRNTMNTWLLNEVSEVLSWHEVSARPVYTEKTPRRSARKRRVRKYVD